MAKKPVGPGGPVPQTTEDDKREVRPQNRVETIASAQVKRNLAAPTSTTSKFCRLPESNKQNYRIDRALEGWHSIPELMTVTECSEERIKSHIRYIMKNCADHCHREFDPNDSKRFMFVCDQ